VNGATTNKGQIYIIVCAIAILAVICVVTVCVLSYLQIKVPPELNTLTGGLVGYLAAMLVKTSPTETIKAPPVSALPTTTDPTPVNVVNPPTAPVPTTTEN
jgi:xanthine/uracil permease